MRKFIRLGIFLVLFVGIVTVTAFADNTDVYFANSWTGVVTCTKAGLRATPNIRAGYEPYYREMNGKKYTNVKNSDELEVVGQTADGVWYIVRALTECESENCMSIVPVDLYIRSCFVKLNPCYLKLGKLTVISSAPWEGAPAVGEKSKNTVLTLLAESQNWYCVQLGERTAGAGFISKLDFSGEIYTEKPE